MNEEEKREYQKKYHRQYRREMKVVAIDIGTCTKCFQEKGDPMFKLCLKCRIKARDNARIRRKGGEKWKKTLGKH